MGNFDPRRATAIHEAGHVVAHIRLNIEYGHVTIAPKGDTLGAATAAGQEHVWKKEDAGPMVIAFCAGYAAMIAAGYSEEDARRGCDDDFEQAAELLDYWGLPDGLEAWQPRAVELMRSPENVSAVALFAEHLLRHERLEADYLDVLIELADGAITEADFAHYRL